MQENRVPNHIALINASRLATDREVAFWAEAVRIQIREAAQAWGWPAPGVGVYSESTFVPSGEGVANFVIDDDHNPDISGSHGYVGGVSWGEVDMRDSPIPSVVFSHEALEELGNLLLDRFAVDEYGYSYPRELCDAVQDDTYPIEVTIFGDTKEVLVSNYLLPSWFDPKGAPPYDRLMLLRRPFQISPGGYTMVTAPDGHVVMRTSQGGAVMASRTFKRTSRAHKIARLAEIRGR